MFLEVVGFNKTLADKLNDRIHRSNSRLYSRCGGTHFEAIVDVTIVDVDKVEHSSI
jgi:hypothetical protein